LQNKNKKIKLAHKLIEEHKKNPNYKVKRISKNTAYKRGRQFEYRVKKHFEKQGYYVVRKYASKGAEDLIAMKSIDLRKTSAFANYASETFFIQCKNLKVEKKLDKKEAQRLKDLARQCGGTPLLASNANHKLNITEVE
jgi:Holliday junction resolvase